MENVKDTGGEFGVNVLILRDLDGRFLDGRIFRPGASYNLSSAQNNPKARPCSKRFHYPKRFL